MDVRKSHITVAGRVTLPDNRKTGHLPWNVWFLHPLATMNSQGQEFKSQHYKDRTAEGKASFGSLVALLK